MMPEQNHRAHNYSLSPSPRRPWRAKDQQTDSFRSQVAEVVRWSRTTYGSRRTRTRNGRVAQEWHMTISICFNPARFESQLRLDAEENLFTTLSDAILCARVHCVSAYAASCCVVSRRVASCHVGWVHEVIWL